jgi:hypothetical protein
MVRYTAWLALLGTVAASSLQPYFSAVNKFFRDHQRKPIAVGELHAAIFIYGNMAIGIEWSEFSRYGTCTCTRKRREN